MNLLAPALHSERAAKEHALKIKAAQAENEAMAEAHAAAVALHVSETNSAKVAADEAKASLSTLLVQHETSTKDLQQLQLQQQN